MGIIFAFPGSNGTAAEAGMIRLSAMTHLPKIALCIRKTILCLGLSLVFGVSAALCSDIYRINDRPVLLYKIIQAWENCLENEAALMGRPEKPSALSGSPEENHLPISKCGHLQGARITGISEARLTAAPSASESEIVLSPSPVWRDSLLDTESIYQLAGRCIFLNSAFFNGSDRIQTVWKNGAFRFFNLPPAAAARLRRDAEMINIRIEGTIQGVRNGKITLFPANEKPLPCPGTATGIPSAAATLSLISNRIEEVLATFEMVRNVPFIANPTE